MRIEQLNDLLWSEEARQQQLQRQAEEEQEKRRRAEKQREARASLGFQAPRIRGAQLGPRKLLVATE